MITVPGRAAVDYSRYRILADQAGDLYVECLLCDIGRESGEELYVDQVIAWVKKHRVHCQAGWDEHSGVAREQAEEWRNRK